MGVAGVSAQARAATVPPAPTIVPLTPATAASVATSSKAVLVATVNMQNAVISSQDNRTIHISFDFSNRQIAQPSVLYSVSLIASSTKGKSVVDTHVYSDVVVLGENVTVHKDIVYTAPASLSGSYEVILQSKSDTGFPLGVTSAGVVTLSGATSGVGFLPNTCYLTIPGEKGSPKYTLPQGVDIAKTESLQLNCSVKNFGTSPLSLTPSYETHFRSIYGAVVAANGGDITPVALAADETKTIALVLPKATNPQSYDVLVALKDGQTASNDIDVHYVIQGMSATLQTISLDQDEYASGATANVSFLWTPSADGFPGSRGGATKISATTVRLTLQDGKGAECAAAQTVALPLGFQVKLPMPITRTCVDPHLSIDLLSADGTVLAHGELTRISTAKAGLDAHVIEEAGAAVLVLIIICVAVWYRARRSTLLHA